MEADDLNYYDYLSNASESGKFIFLIMESFPQGIVISDTDDKVIYANFKMAQLTGYSRKEMLGKPVSFYLQVQDQQHPASPEEQKPGAYENYELLIKRENSTPYLGHTVTAPYKDMDGKVIGTIRIITDVTIANRSAELEGLAIGATKALNSVIITDKYGKIEWVNEGFTRLSGYQLFEIIDTKGEGLRKNHEEFMSKFEEALNQKKSVACECFNISKSGEEYKVKATITPISDHQGDVKDVIIIETDIPINSNLSFLLS